MYEKEEMNRIRRYQFANQYSSWKIGTWMRQGYLKYIVLLCAFISLSMGVSHAAMDGDAKLVTGKGIVITQGDVDNFRQYMNKGSFSTSDQQLLKVLLRITLFATEAKKLGLGGDRKFGNDKIGKLQKTIWLSESYTEKLLSDYPVSDLVIESYYFSHPEKFPQKDGDGQGIGDKEKEEIRNIVRSTKRQEIAEKALEDLKAKYQIQLIEGATK